MPRVGIPPPSRVRPPGRWIPLPRTIREPDASFLQVLRSRRSEIGSDVGVQDVSSLLWHATALRERRGDGRFGIPWESRPAPSPGGLHPIRIVVLPLNDETIAGEYLPDHHSVAPIDPEALRANRVSIAELLCAAAGTTLQFACDESLVEACYQHAPSLMWREAGALATTISLVATSLGLTSVILGRIGKDILSAAGVDERFAGVGAVHIGLSTPTWSRHDQTSRAELPNSNCS